MECGLRGGSSHSLCQGLIENATEGSIYLSLGVVWRLGHLTRSSWRLDCAEGFQGSLLEAAAGDPGLLKQRGCHSLVFQVTPESDSVDSASVRLREVLGTLALWWQVPDGPRGCMEGHEIQVKPSQALGAKKSRKTRKVLHLDLSVVECPRKVKVETPFSLELQAQSSEEISFLAGDEPHQRLFAGEGQRLCRESERV